MSMMDDTRSQLIQSLCNLKYCYISLLLEGQLVHRGSYIIIYIYGQLYIYYGFRLPRGDGVVPSRLGAQK